MTSQTAAPRTTVQLVLASMTWTYLCLITVVWLCGGLGSPDPLTVVASGLFIFLVGSLGALGLLAVVIGGALLFFEAAGAIKAARTRITGRRA